MADADWLQLATIRGRILGEPNSLRQNLTAAIGVLPTQREQTAAREARARLRGLS